MRYATAQTVFQEVPDEVSVAFLVTGCPMRCHGCHSSDAWNGARGHELTEATIDAWIERSRGFLSCVLFLGGEWDPAGLKRLLDHARARGLKTCLYTGLELEQVDPELVSRLDFLKVGSWVAELGGLDSPRTNQKFIEMKTGRILNHRFQEGGSHGQAHGSATGR